MTFSAGSHVVAWGSSSSTWIIPVRIQKHLVTPQRIAHSSLFVYFIYLFIFIYIYIYTYFILATLPLVCCYSIRTPRRVASWVNYSCRWTESSSEHFASNLSLLKADALRSEISSARIRIHDLWIRKRVCYPLHHSAPQNNTITKKFLSRSETTGNLANFNIFPRVKGYSERLKNMRLKIDQAM